MKILDLRPKVVTWLESQWSKNSVSAGGATPGNIVTRTWGNLVAYHMTRRVAQRGRPAGSPYIVSIGNLALGGTGKTPLVIRLAQDLAATGLRGCVLTRGYRSALSGPLIVTPEVELAGDEARLMAQDLGPLGWSVIQSQRRSAGLAFCRDKGLACDLVLIEDGHQTAHLARHLDVLILDRWSTVDAADGPVVKPETGPVFPLGAYRESAVGARRAAIWVVEATGAVPRLGVGGAEVCAFQKQVTLSGKLPVGKPALLSGIARPERFEAGVCGLLPVEPVLAIRGRDHEAYSPRLSQRVVAELSTAGADYLVTTTKDWIKLAPFWPSKVPVVLAEVEMVWKHSQALPHLVRKRLEQHKQSMGAV